MPEILAAGFRVIAPWLRGFGNTSFNEDRTPRTGNSGILAMDRIAFMDSLGVKKFNVIGHDWGSNIAEALAVARHSYQARWQEAAPDPESAALEEQVKATKTLSLPTLYIQEEVDGVNPPYVREHVQEKFTGWFHRVVMRGVGHFPSREAANSLSSYLTEFLRGTFI